MRKSLVIFFLGILFGIPSLASAALINCAQIGGTCMSKSLCTIRQYSDPSIQDWPGQETDCHDPNDLDDPRTCCLLEKQTVTGTHCKESPLFNGLGGRCAVSCGPEENDKGEDDCGSPLKCCVPVAPAPETCDALQGRFCALDCPAAGGTEVGFDCGPGLHCCHQDFGSQCELNGGHCSTMPYCSSDANEQSLGQYDCKTGTLCCRVPTEAPVSTASGTAGTSGGGGPIGAPPGTLFEAIKLTNPATLNCIQTGNCTVDDIVYTGVGFARFLIGLSGALFFLIFIYGGAMYLASFGDKGRVEKGKKAIMGAAIGIMIVAGAWTIVKYIVGGLTGQTVSGSSAGSGAASTSAYKGCGENELAGYSCKTFSDAKSTQELLSKCQADGNVCVPGKCPGQKDICAKSK